jgi:hypothetical protein
MIVAQRLTTVLYISSIAMAPLNRNRPQNHPWSENEDNDIVANYYYM